MGRHALLRVWQAVQEGCKDGLSPFVGFDANPLTTLGSKHTGGDQPTRPSAS
jgi:hypothetical protein